MLLDTRIRPAEGAAPQSPCKPAPAWAADIPVAIDAELWVFAYGSLMWNPGFPSIEHGMAVLHGYHRRFCIASHRYRGTPEKPGLVLGLDRGGSCRGMAFRVAAEHIPETLDYLWEREMVNRTYRPRLLPVRLADGRAVVDACTFVVDREHSQYCPCLDDAEMVERIACCAGERGSNLEYLTNTVEHLEQLGIHDARLSALMAEVHRRLDGALALIP
ncbi:MAG TPA: gamma-glutamylcyclotransferase [Azospirillum sp.]|nr:gamma-glutamylcyclotransferase [Azospirillum sp.]